MALKMARLVDPSTYFEELPENPELLHFYPAKLHLLPSGHALVLNVMLGSLSYIALSPDCPYPRLLAEQQFTASELTLLLPLLSSFPHYCPYEVMLSSFNTGQVSEKAVERARRRLHEALEEGVWDQEMRPVRNVLSRTRLKMRTLGIEISSILETGYVLMPLPERKQRALAGALAS